MRNRTTHTHTYRRTHFWVSSSQHSLSCAVGGRSGPGARDERDGRGGRCSSQHEKSESLGGGNEIKTSTRKSVHEGHRGLLLHGGRRPQSTSRVKKLLLESAPRPALPGRNLCVPLCLAPPLPTPAPPLRVPAIHPQITCHQPRTHAPPSRERRSQATHEVTALPSALEVPAQLSSSLPASRAAYEASCLSRCIPWASSRRGSPAVRSIAYAGLCAARVPKE